MKKDELKSNQNLSPTPYPDVNAVLEELLPEVQAILGDHFIGMYLYSSLAYGGFDMDSDVDFVVATTEELPDTLFVSLQAMHAQIATLDSWCATQLEGSYIPQQSLQHYDPIHAFHLHIDRGQGEHLQKMEIEDDNLSRAWWGGWGLLRLALLKKGITLTGPAPETFITPVSADDLKQATLAILQGSVVPLLEQPIQIKYCGMQSYTVLTLCRTLYTLEYDTIVSKQVAARWAQERLGEPWVTLIKHAWTGRHNPRAKSPMKDVNGTLEFIRYTMEITNGAHLE